VQRVRAEATHEKEEYESDDEFKEESEGCSLCGDSEEEENLPIIQPYPVYSYAEKAEKPMMQTKKTMTKAKKSAVIEDPLHSNTSSLEGDEYEQYDDPEEEDMEEEEEPPMKTKGKKKTMPTPNDYSEELSFLRERLNALEYSFAEERSELRSQNDLLSETLLDAKLQIHGLEEEQTRQAQEFAEKEELMLRNEINDFVEKLESEGQIPASLTGDYELSFSEDTLDFNEALFQISQATPEAFDVLSQFLSGLPSFDDRTPANFSEDDEEPYVAPSPIESAGLKLPKGSVISEGSSNELQAYIAYGQANGLNFSEEGDRKQIIKAVRGH
jgi:hypothetical protein